MNRKILTSILGLSMIASTGCDMLGGKPTGSPYVARGNSPPIIQALTANPLKITKDTEVKIKVSAFDGDGDTLAYKWSCSKGAMVKTTGDEVSWKPMKDGKIDSGIGIIIAEISDGKNKVAGAVNILINSDGTGNVDVSTEIINLDCQQPVGKNVDVLVKDDLLAPVKDKIAVVADNSIKIDGLIDGWAGIFPVCIDQARDTGQPNDNAHDIKNFYLAKDSKYLYYRIDTWNTPDPAHGTSYRITVGSTGLITKDSTPDNLEFVMKDVSEGKIDLSKLGDINNQYICGVFKQKDGAVRDRTRLIQIVDGKSTTSVTPTASSAATGTETYLLKQESIAGVSNNPPNKTILTLSSPAHITKIFTYHWNGGSGDPPGTVSLKNTVTGEILGPWNALGFKDGISLVPGATWPTTPNGPPHRYWIAQPNVDVPAGTYELVDSKPATWSYTSDAGNKGLSDIFGWTTGAAPAGTASPTITTKSVWTSAFAGSSHTLAIKSDGTLWSWGRNIGGELGDGTLVTKNIATQITTASNWKFASADYHNVAIKADGTLWAWGSNSYGQLGDGAVSSDKSTPIQIGTASNWASVVAGQTHTVAIKTDGTLWAWGDNGDSQLGDGTSVRKNVPTQIGTASDWASVAAGSGYSVAIKTDGTLWTWGGRNGFGNFGDIPDTSVPSQISTGYNGASVYAGKDYTVIKKTDGTLWAWGFNDYGQLGDGTSVRKINLTQIGTASNWASVAAGDAHTVAIKTDGTLWVWGRNNEGQLGDGTTADKNTPTQIGTASDWASVSAGDYHTVARKTDGTLWVWGKNDYGQLGDGTTVAKIIPTNIP